MLFDIIDRFLIAAYFINFLTKTSLIALRSKLTLIISNTKNLLHRNSTIITIIEPKTLSQTLRFIHSLKNDRFRTFFLIAFQQFIVFQK